MSPSPSSGAGSDYPGSAPFLAMPQAETLFGLEERTPTLRAGVFRPVIHRPSLFDEQPGDQRGQLTIEDQP